MEEIREGPKIEDFSMLKPISQGAFGKVFLGCKKQSPSNMYAIKVLDKSDIVHRNMASQVTRERNALAISKSPFCVQLFYCMQNSSNIFLVMEYINGGDLKSILKDRGYFDEQMATFYVTEVALALEYLHMSKIVHRDVKPDNMLLSDKGHVKLADFGLSRVHIVRDLKISDLVSPAVLSSSVSKDGYHMERTPGQLLSLTSHLSFQNGMSPYSGQGHVLSTPEAMRDHPAYHRDKSYHFEMSGDFTVGLSPPNSAANVSMSKIFKFADLESDIGATIDDDNGMRAEDSKTPKCKRQLLKEEVQEGNYQPVVVINASKCRSPNEGCILGTPDYLAPELLLKKSHGPAVDWWSLGVCLYEFLLGGPPFNDETTEQIFDNILKRKIEWPPEDDNCLRPAARQAIEALLTPDPSDRADGSRLRTLALFAHLPWTQEILNQIPPFLPPCKD